VRQFEFIAKRLNARIAMNSAMNGPDYRPLRMARWKWQFHRTIAEGKDQLPAGIYRRQGGAYFLGARNQGTPLPCWARRPPVALIQARALLLTAVWKLTWH
jgi:hypothetical protein